MPRERRTGKVAFLRAHDVGTGWSAGNNALDVEVVFRLEGSEGINAYGFKLRQDASYPPRRAMFDLLRDAFNQGWDVDFEYDRADDSVNGEVLRLAVFKAKPPTLTGLILGSLLRRRA